MYTNHFKVLTLTQAPSSTILRSYPHSIYDIHPKKLPAGNVTSKVTFFEALSRAKELGKASPKTPVYAPMHMYPNVHSFVQANAGNLGADYNINPYMHEGSIGQENAGRFAEDSLEVMKFITEGNAFPVMPIYLRPLSIKEALIGIPDREASPAEKAEFTEILKSECNDEGLFLKKEAGQLKRLERAIDQSDTISIPAKEKLKEALRAIESVYSDSIYQANALITLGHSKKVGEMLGLYDDNGQAVAVPIVIPQSPKYGEREVELLQTLGIMPHAFPLVLNEKFEGLADLMTAPNGKVIGNVSSRSTAASYDKVFEAGELLGIENFPKKEDLIKLKVKDQTLRQSSESHEGGLGLSDKDQTFLETKLEDLFYHGDLCILPLPDRVLLVEGVFEDASIQSLRDAGISIEFIPMSEGLNFAMNSILIDERRGGESRRAVIPSTCPTLKEKLEANEYETRPSDLIYDAGGGFQRCMYAQTHLELNRLPQSLTTQNWSHVTQQLNKEHGAAPLFREFRPEEQSVIQSYLDAEKGLINSALKA